jgi:hypothetical protein
MELPLFERASRRAVLRRGLAATGVLAAGAWLAACSNDDKNAFDSPATTSSSGAATSSTSSTSSSGAATSSTAPTATTAPAAAAAAASVGIRFTYAAADASGRVRNPYIAAWVEDQSSTMVGLISVWYEARESKYLRELTQFSAASGDVTSTAVDAVSGATRPAGQYRLQWDGKGLDGAVLTGSHTLWIEAAREHGPHSVMSGPVVLGQAGSTTVAGGGELSDAVVTIG